MTIKFHVFLIIPIHTKYLSHHIFGFPSERFPKSFLAEISQRILLAYFFLQTAVLNT
jgi:hypothetical protein